MKNNEHISVDSSTINAPKILNINSRRYRLNPFWLKRCLHGGKAREIDENCTISKNTIQKNDDGVSLVLNDISPYYFRILRDKYSLMLNNISSKTGVTIIIPKIASEQQHIILTANHGNKYISEVEQEIKTIITGIGINFNATHFLSIPMQSHDLRQNMEIFKTRIINLSKNCNNRLKRYIRNFNLLHLTVAMLDFTTPEKMENGFNAFDKICTKHVNECNKNGPLVVNLIGVDVMNPDPKQATVLYAKVHELNNSGRLQILCDSILKDLKACGFIYPNDNDSRVLLHMTLLKTPTVNSDSNARETFDATHLLEEFKEFQFGAVVVKSIQLSCLMEIDQNTNYYRCLKNITFI